MRVVAIFALVAALTAAARAEESPEEVATRSNEEADRHFDRASRAFEAHAYAAAFIEFQAAAPALTDSQLHYHLARCLELDGHETPAMVLYRQSSRAVGDDAYARAARARMEELVTRANTRLHPPRALGLPLALGIGTLIVGGVGATLAGSVTTPLSELRSAVCDAPCDAARSLHVRADVGYAFLGLAGAALVADVVLWIRWSRGRSPPSMSMWTTSTGLRF